MKILEDPAPRPQGSSAHDICVARQSIYDANLNIAGYEVLYRDRGTMPADSNQATSELLMNAVVEIGLERIVGEKPAFIRFTREFLLGHLPMPLAPSRLVIEILEDVTIDNQLIGGLSQLVAQGYTLALDDVLFRLELMPLLELARIVRVELPTIQDQELDQHVRRFNKYPVALLAGHVETGEEYKRCRQLGFKYFQGFFLSRPQTVSGKKRRASDIAVVQLLGKLSDPNVTVDALEQVIKNDAALSYKLLRYINSARFCLHTRIDSLRQVILLLGVQGIRTIAMLAALDGTTKQPGDVLKDATQRAVLCERLARLLDNDVDASSCFTAGLISSLDAVLDMPLTELLESLPLSEALKKAVLHHTGPIGEVLVCAIAIERADWDAIKCGTLSAEQIGSAYLSAIGDVGQMSASFAP